MRDICADFYYKFKAIEEKQGHGFVALYALRRRLGLSHKEFNGLIEGLRAAHIITLHSGHHETAQEYMGGYIDKNGFWFGSATMKNQQRQTAIGAR